MLVCNTSLFLLFVTIPSTLALHVKGGGSSRSLLPTAVGADRDRTGRTGLNGTGEAVKRRDTRRLGPSEAGEEEDEDDDLDFNFDEDGDSNISRERMDNMQGKPPGRPGGGGLVPSLVGGGLIPTLVGSDGEHATTFGQPGIRLNCYYCNMMLGGWGGGGGGRPPNHHWQWDPPSKIQQGNPFYGNPPWATTRRGGDSSTRHRLVHNYKTDTN